VQIEKLAAKREAFAVNYKGNTVAARLTGIRTTRQPGGANTAQLVWTAELLTGDDGSVLGFTTGVEAVLGLKADYDELVAQAAEVKRQKDAETKAQKALQLRVANKLAKLAGVKIVTSFGVEGIIARYNNIEITPEAIEALDKVLADEAVTA
jgi:hypothetical protein